MKTGFFRCTICKHKTSVLAGTIFQGTRKPLRPWLQAIWYITSQKFGGSALGLKRIFGLKSYQTAWSWLHKMRRAMIRPDRSTLSGNIEVHEPKGFGRVRLKRIPDMSGDSLILFICNNVQQNSTVITDCWKYNTLQKYEYTHKQVNLSQSGDPAHVHLPGVHDLRRY